MDIVLYAYVFTALLYAGLAVVAWWVRLRTLPGNDAESGAGKRIGEYRMARAAQSRIRVPGIRHGLLLLALICHGVLLHVTIFLPNQMVFGFAFALSAMLWLSTGIYWIESFFFPLEGLGLMALPLASIATLLPLQFGGRRILAYAANPLFKCHFLIANMAYGLLALAVLHALLMLLIGQRLAALHREKGSSNTRTGSWLDRWLDSLPPLLTLEKVLFRLIWAGFVLLTLTLITGVWVTEQLPRPGAYSDHKTVFAVLSWLMFGGLLIGRQLYGWRGRAALRWVLVAFAVLLLAYIGSRFVLEV